MNLRLGTIRTSNQQPPSGGPMLPCCSGSLLSWYESGVGSIPTGSFVDKRSMELNTNIKRGKVWGNTSCLFAKNNVELHRIEAKKGGFCSKHCHRSKFNMFFVENGALKITIYRPDAGQILEDETIIKTGESTLVEPGLYHKFEALEDSVALEVYWVELEHDDIERESVGGMK